jgi:hypothetical protein
MKSIKIVHLNWLICSICFFAIILLIILRFLVSNYMHLNWDTPILIDGAYRVFLNQKPHVDFSTPVGPIIFIVGAIGMRNTKNFVI